MTAQTVVDAARRSRNRTCADCGRQPEYGGVRCHACWRVHIGKDSAHGVRRTPSRVDAQRDYDRRRQQAVRDRRAADVR